MIARGHNRSDSAVGNMSSVSFIPPHRPRLILAGASVRGLACSAARAGFEVHAADLFADLDLRAVAASFRSPRPYPAGLPAAVAGLPAGAWAYTGAVENHPAVIAEISRHRPLAGCDPKAVESVRDPHQLAAVVEQAGLFMPDTRLDPAGLPTDGSWLLKPRRSAGGHGIEPWLGTTDPTRQGQGRDLLWQRRVTGRTMAAAYLATAEGCRLVGASRQLVGRRWCRSRPFHYCGSIDLDPATLPSGLTTALSRFGHLLTSAFGLVGLVGVDLVIDPQGRPTVIEVNPRPTASMELIERATGLSLAGVQVAACRLGPAPEGRGWQRTGTWSKAILFADHEIAFGESGPAVLEAAAGPPDDGWPALADIPAPPQTIPPGHPICTLFARADSPRESLARLRRRTSDVARTLVPLRAEPLAAAR